VTNLIARREYNSQGRVVKTSTAGSNTTRTLHAQGQVFSQKDSASNWEWMLADGLGSVRGVVSSAAGVLEHRHFDPLGNLFAGAMSQSEYGFTGEPFDSATGMLYLRARHYRPANGTFVSRDPFEGTMSRPMSRNGYSWVEGRVADGRDSSGMIYETPTRWNSCPSAKIPILSCDDLAAQMFGSESLPYEVSLAKASFLDNCYKNSRLSLLSARADSLLACLNDNQCHSVGGTPRPANAISALRDLIAFGETLPDLLGLNNTRELVDDISSILLGSTGPYTIVNALFNIRNWHGLARLSTGIHSDYYQPEGQIAHFWSFLNTFVQGGYAVGMYADFTHECRGVSGITDFFSPSAFGTIPDARLTTAALLISNSIGNALPLSSHIYNALTNEFVGINGFLGEWYYSNLSCWDLAKAEYLDRTGNQLPDSQLQYYPLYS